MIPVHSEGFRGTKKDGYKAACEALFRLVGKDDETPAPAAGINILGDFNLAGETWIIKEYYRRMGVEVVVLHHRRRQGRRDTAGAPGSPERGPVLRLDDLPRQDDGGDHIGIPFRRVSYFGIEDTAEALYTVARHFDDPEVLEQHGGTGAGK